MPGSEFLKPPEVARGRCRADVSRCICQYLVGILVLTYWWKVFKQRDARRARRVRFRCAPKARESRPSPNLPATKTASDKGCQRQGRHFQHGSMAPACGRPWRVAADGRKAVFCPSTPHERLDSAPRPASTPQTHVDLNQDKSRFGKQIASCFPPHPRLLRILPRGPCRMDHGGRAASVPWFDRIACGGNARCGANSGHGASAGGTAPDLRGRPRLD